VIEQWQNSASFARASLSHLGERCRSLNRVLAQAFRSGNPVRELSDTLSRSGEIGSPKRGREEIWMFWARLLAQARSFGVLSERYTRLGENGSPKRGRDETCSFCWLNPRPGEELCVYWATWGLAQVRRARLSEMKRYNHCYMLTQTRWASLSETGVLAWVNRHGLSENGEEPCSYVLFGLLFDIS